MNKARPSHTQWPPLGPVDLQVATTKRAKQHTDKSWQNTRIHANFAHNTCVRVSKKFESALQTLSVNNNQVTGKKFVPHNNTHRFLYLTFSVYMYMPFSETICKFQVSQLHWEQAVGVFCWSPVYICWPWHLAPFLWLKSIVQDILLLLDATRFTTVL